MTLSRSAAMQWLVVALFLFGGLYLLGPILSPFVAAAILAYICNPLVIRLRSLKVPRTLSVVLVMLGGLLLVVAIFLIMLPLLQKEMGLLVVRIPEWVELARQHLMPQLQQWFGFNLDWDARTFRNLVLSHWQSAGGVAAKVLPWLESGGGMLFGLFVNLLLIPVVMFYLLRDWDEIMQRIDHMIPRHWHAKVSEIASEVDSVLAEFLRGQLSVMLLMSAFYVGALCLGLTFATLAATMQFSSVSDVLYVWAVFGAGQLLEGMVVTPWLVGDRIGLHPLAVIFALLAFGQLFGFFGVLLALPLAAILLVVLRHTRERYLSSEMYNKL